MGGGKSLPFSVDNVVYNKTGFHKDQLKLSEQFVIIFLCIRELYEV